ncbi:hypothetical protein ACM26V_19220 [Salipaludibacillus sp. HK11]|uniref:hypothetical protein n=1 Tax=Salipaludibacillus sp. HK11 TaxID=3394320 RepID=UPI0039FC868F
MSFLDKLFNRKHESKQIRDNYDYKADFLKLVEEVGPEPKEDFVKIFLAAIEEEEKHRTTDEMLQWFQKLEEENRLPSSMAQEEFLMLFYKRDPDLIKRYSSLHFEVQVIHYDERQEHIATLGKNTSGMSEEAQLTYFALLGESLNIISQMEATSPKYKMNK